jgi:hypothetical protein
MQAQTTRARVWKGAGEPGASKPGGIPILPNFLPGVTEEQIELPVTHSALGHFGPNRRENGVKLAASAKIPLKKGTNVRLSPQPFAIGLTIQKQEDVIRQRDFNCL